MTVAGEFETLVGIVAKMLTAVRLTSASLNAEQPNDSTTTIP